MRSIFSSKKLGLNTELKHKHACQEIQLESIAFNKASSERIRLQRLTNLIHT